MKTNTLPVLLATALLILVLNNYKTAFPPRILAQQNASPSSVATDSAEIKTKEIREIRDAVKKKVQEKIKKITQSIVSGKKQSWYGEIVKIDQSNIYIQSPNQEEERHINISDDTAIIDLKRKTITKEKLKEKLKIIAMGYTDDQKGLDCKRLVITTPPTKWQKTKVVFAKVSDISSESKTIVFIPLQDKEKQYQAIFGKNTNSNTEFNDIEVGQNAVVILTSQEGSKSYIIHKIKIIQKT